MHKEQSNFGYKVGASSSGQETREGSLGENNCGGHTGLGYENVREKESHVDITALIDYLFFVNALTLYTFKNRIHS